VQLNRRNHLRKSKELDAIKRPFPEALVYASFQGLQEMDKTIYNFNKRIQRWH